MGELFRRKYVILYDSSAVYMAYLANKHLHAPASNFPLAVNDKEIAGYGDRGSWRDFAFNMEGIRSTSSTVR